jgi:hypothetical protein
MFRDSQKDSAMTTRRGIIGMVGAALATISFGKIVRAKPIDVPIKSNLLYPVGMSYIFKSDMQDGKLNELWRQIRVSENEWDAILYDGELTLDLPRYRIVTVKDGKLTISKKVKWIETMNVYAGSVAGNVMTGG